MASKFQEFLAAHERLKHRIHNFRAPIHNVFLRNFVMLCYVCIPVGLASYGVSRLSNNFKNQVESGKGQFEDFQTKYKPSASEQELIKKRQDALEEYLQQIKNGKANSSEWGGQIK